MEAKQRKPEDLIELYKQGEAEREEFLDYEKAGRAFLDCSKKLIRDFNRAPFHLEFESNRETHAPRHVFKLYADADYSCSFVADEDKLRWLIETEPHIFDDELHVSQISAEGIEQLVLEWAEACVRHSKKMPQG